MKEHFYRLHVHFERGGDYDVYYRTQYSMPIKDVPWHAVWDGDLIDVFLSNVSEVLEITAEEYFEHMWE